MVNKSLLHVYFHAMKLFLLITILIFFTVSQTTAAQNSLSCSTGEEISLTQFQWENRLLIIFAKNRDHETYKSQMKSFSAVEEQLKERDVVIISIFAEGCSTINGNKITGSSASKIAERFEGSTQTNSIFLIGKDGGVKLRKPGFLEPEDLFQVIDRMPMRQREMRDGE